MVNVWLKTENGVRCVRLGRVVYKFGFSYEPLQENMLEMMGRTGMILDDIVKGEPVEPMQVIGRLLYIKK